MRNDWMLLAEIDLPVAGNHPAARDRASRWLAKALAGLAISAELLTMIQDSARKALERAIRLEPERIDLQVYTARRPGTERAPWGFFRIEKKENVQTGSNALVCKIKFYLYKES